eukprot:2148710-Prymnesium_polylepis.1
MRWRRTRPCATRRSRAAPSTRFTVRRPPTPPAADALRLRPAVARVARSRDTPLISASVAPLSARHPRACSQAALSSRRSRITRTSRTSGRLEPGLAVGVKRKDGSQAQGSVRFDYVRCSLKIEICLDARHGRDEVGEALEAVLDVPVRLDEDRSGSGTSASARPQHIVWDDL